jgi:dGTPase
MAAKNYRLNWRNLLSTQRVRALFGGPKSRKVQGDLRTEFERDYGRTVYSTPFRRLRDKAQVFPLEPNDHVRTRLLHSLEVSSVAEDLAAQAVRDIIASDAKSLTDDNLRSIPLIAATCGLIHDIGNPPFGHAGELAISSWFKSRFSANNTFIASLGGEGSQMVQDFFNFEGNAQGIRSVSNVHLLGDDYGLNFTAGTLAAACKYIAPANDLVKENVHERSKPGYFTSETEIVTRVRTLTGTPDCRHPITYLVEAADDIVYCSVDLEDGIRRGVLDWHDVELSLLKQSAKADIVKKVLQQARDHVRPARLSGKAKYDELAQAFRIAAISQMVIAARRTFQKRYADIMNGEYHGELIMDPLCGAKPMIDACKHVLKNDLYRHKDILRLEVRGRRVIHELLDLFWEGVSSHERGKGLTTKSYGGKLFLLFSENYRRLFEKRLRDRKENHLYCRFQLLTDQISGMTDTYACRLHKDLTNT